MSTLAVVVDWTASSDTGADAGAAAAVAAGETTRASAPYNGARAASFTPAALTARRMLDCLRDRSPDGIATVAAPGGAALGLGKLVVAHKQGHGPQPLIDQQAGLYLVADVRIDNRDDLRSELVLGREATDADIVLAGYRQWGPHVPEHLIGDFAFAVWDARERTLFAARDPFGVRPLVYRRTPDGARLLLASDVEQILEVDATAWEVDEETVLDYVTDRWRSTERTFFAGIQALPGGHYLLASDGRWQQRRWWRPPADHSLISDHQECYRQFRQALSRAVADRLDSDHPAVIQVSGGFDSPSIALTAGQVGARVPLRAICALHPGLDCDEKSFVEALRPRLPFPVEYWDGTDVVLPDLERPARSGPGRRGPFVDGSRAGLDIVQREKARVILSGSGGDSWQPNVFSLEDYLRERRWRQLLAAAFFRPQVPWSKRFASLKHTIRFFTPETLVARMRLRRPDLDPRQALYLGVPPPSAVTARASEHDWMQGLPGAANRARLRELTGPRFAREVDIHQSCATQARAELRFPFLDTRLLDLLWRLPLGIWRSPGYPARFHAQAMADLLPPEIALRRRKTLFTSAAAHCRAVARPVIETILQASPWKCGRYLDEPAGRALAKSDPELAWNLATLEAWLEIVYGRPANLGSEGESKHAIQV